MKITCTLSSASIASAVEQLNRYAESFEKKSEKLVQSLGDFGAECAANYLGHFDTGETLSSLTFTRNGVTGTIFVAGNAVWIEFGTGVLANAGNTPHPKKDDLGMFGWGEYGHGYGQGVWEFPSKEYGWGMPIPTEGIPMNQFMYHSAQDMRREMQDIAKEVFKDD